jgi:hypothetical protein
VFEELLGTKLRDARIILDDRDQIFCVVLTKAPGTVSAVTEDSRVIRIRKTRDDLIELVVCDTAVDGMAVKINK